MNKRALNANSAARGAARTATILLTAVLLCGLYRSASASQAYGSTNNFDCVNDTGVEAHGFDIELDDLNSIDVTYTYDHNHYGVPKITEDLTVPTHPKVLVRYASAKNPNGTWAAYTAIPSGPISPTMGHQFTDPSVNFGGEHFGVGFTKIPSAVKYNWLIDDGAGNLIHGAPVMVATPTFTYNQPAGGAPANIVAQIVPPPPPAPPPLEFGDACWVKAIKTSTVNANKIPLDQLVADDPGQPQPWTNGEPSEVEIEWQVLQTDFLAGAGGGVHGNMVAAPEDLPNDDEVVTRRYEFYKYVGPLDAETGQAVGDTVGPDGLHGIGLVTYADHFDPNLGEWITVTVDMSTVVVVGDFFGAQMAAFDKGPKLDLIDQIQDGDIGVPFPNRTVVIAGGSPFNDSISSGKLPDGLTLDPVSGVLSGTPTTAGAFTFKVSASDLSGANVSRTYTVTISGISGFYALPSIITGGYGTRGVVRLSQVAGAGGQPVSLQTDNASATVPATVTIPEGLKAVSFAINSSVVPTSTVVNVTATFGASSLKTVLTLNPPPLTRIYVMPSSVTGGTGTSGVIQTPVKAPIGGFTVSLQSNSADAIIPASVNVPSGTTGVSFAVTSKAVSTSEDVTLTATLGTSTQQTTLTLTPYPMSNFYVLPSEVTGGVGTRGVVQLTGIAGPAGNVVSLQSGSSSAQVPTTVTVPAGMKGVSFAITTSIVASSTPVTLTATFGSSSKQTSLTLDPITLSGLYFWPNNVVSGHVAVGVVQISGPAGPGGVTVQLSSDIGSTYIQLPASVVIPQGKTGVTFSAYAPPINAGTQATVTATLGSSTKQTTLAISSHS